MKNKVIHDIAQDRRFVNTVAIVTALLILLPTLYFGIRAFKRSSPAAKAFSRFQKALSEGEYETAYEQYKYLQDRSSDLERNVEERDEHAQYQIRCEESVRERVEKILDNVKNGALPAEEDYLFISEMHEVSASALIPFLHESTKDFLDARISRSTWHFLMESMRGPANLYLIADALISQEDAFVEAAERFEAARKRQEGDDWEATWHAWQAISEDTELAAFARSYAGEKLLSFQTAEYENLISEAERMIDEKRYYSAHDLLDRMFKVFPAESRLRTLLDESVAALPPAINNYVGMIDQLAIRPLCLKPEIGFADKDSASYATNSFITAKEFENLLERLHAENYVLINSDIYNIYPEDDPMPAVPKGKKPLILIFDEFAMSGLMQYAGTAASYRYEDGICKTLFRNEVGELYADNTRENAFAILDRFVEENADFSFDGAKATVALTGFHGVLGHICNDRQLNNLNEFRRSRQLDEFVMTSAKMADEKSELQILCNELKHKGYIFSSATYAGINVAKATASQLEEDLTSFQEEVLPYTGKIKNMQFPDGANCYDKPENLRLLLNAGFNCFSGIGPKLYNFKSKSFIHLDKVQVNGFSLYNAQASGVSRFVEPYAVLDDHDRAYSYRGE